ncbi:hypothetical protein CBL_04228 [Carabus blaptoides fortunei]
MLSLEAVVNNSDDEHPESVDRASLWKRLITAYQSWKANHATVSWQFDGGVTLNKTNKGQTQTNRASAVRRDLSCVDTGVSTCHTIQISRATDAPLRAARLPPALKLQKRFNLLDDE